MTTPRPAGHWHIRRNTLPQRFHRILLWAWRFRLVLAALLLSVTASNALSSALAHRSERQIQVVVAARALPIGHTLTASDLQTRSYPSDLAPQDRGSAADMVGQTLAAPLTEQAPVTRTALRGASQLTGLHSSMSCVGIVLRGANAVPTLRVGDHIDVSFRSVGSQDNSSEVVVLARRAVVVQIDQSAGGRLSAGEAKQSILIATDAPNANNIATLADAKNLGVTLVS